MAVRSTAKVVFCHYRDLHARIISRLAGQKV